MVVPLLWPYIEYVPDFNRFYRQLGYRLKEIEEEHSWDEEDFKPMDYNYKSWERHRRGDAGMTGASALKVVAMSEVTPHELFSGTDKGIYRKLPPVVRRRPYLRRKHFDAIAEDRFRTRMAGCRSSSEGASSSISLCEFTVRLGWRIRRLRLEKGWSSGDIAARKGDWNSWQEWETGKKCPKISSWVNICEILEINLDLLLRDIETEGDEVLSVVRSPLQRRSSS